MGPPRARPPAPALAALVIAGQTVIVQGLGVVAPFVVLPLYAGVFLLALIYGELRKRR